MCTGGGLWFSNPPPPGPELKVKVTRMENREHMKAQRTLPFQEKQPQLLYLKHLRASWDCPLSKSNRTGGFTNAPNKQKLRQIVGPVSNDSQHALLSNQEHNHHLIFLFYLFVLVFHWDLVGEIQYFFCQGVQVKMCRGKVKKFKNTHRHTQTANRVKNKEQT